MASYQITITTSEGSSSFACADDQYILDAAEEAGADLPYSCRAGAQLDPRPPSRPALRGHPRQAPRLLRASTRNAPEFA